PLALDPDDRSFGHNDVDGEFQTFIQSAPGVLDVVGPYNPPAGGFVNAGDFMGDALGIWWTIDSNGLAVAVNTATGETTEMGTIAAPAGVFTGLTWDFVTSQFYAVSGDCQTANQTLSIIDFGALTATPVGTDATTTCLTDVAAHPLTGQLYTYDLVTDALYALDKAAGQTTLIGGLGFDANFGQAMDFDNQDLTLYLYAFNRATCDAELRIADLATGATTLVGTIGPDIEQFGAASSSTLLIPVELVSFDAVVNGSDVTLAWATASETNNAGFEVQMKSGDAWSPLGFVAGHGTTTEAQTYAYTAAGLDPGTYRFRLKQIDYDGVFEYSPEVEATVGVPGAYTLRAAYPNPSNPTTSFTFAVAQSQHVAVEVYNALGQRVATLYEGALEGGVSHPFTFEAGSLPSGLYIVRATGETFAASQKVTLLK